MSSVRYSRLQSQGVIYGLSKASIVGLFVVAVFVAIGVMQNGVLGLLTTLPVTFPVAFISFVHAHGEPLLVHVWREVMGRTRKMFGLNTFKDRPEKRELSVVGALRLPGREDRLHLWEAADGSVVVWDAVKMTASVTCLVATQGMGRGSLLSPEEKEAFTVKWAQVLGSFTQRAHISRIAVQEQTRPGTVAAERLYMQEHAEHSAAFHSYQQALDLAEEIVTMHRTQVTVTIDTTKSEGKEMVKAQGGGKLGVLSLMELEMGSVAEALGQAGFTRVAWLNPREWAAWGRGLIDPAAQSMIDARLGSAYEGVDPEASIPMVVQDERTWVETDSAWHRTFWINEWPRLDTYPGFLDTIVFARNNEGVPVRHTFMLVMDPTLMNDALKKVEEQKRTWRTNQALRAKAGKPDSASDEADWNNIVQHERDLVAGQGELRFGAFITVTALTKDDLEKSAATMRNACAMAGLEPRILAWSQAEALMNVAYPSGLGMK